MSSRRLIQRVLEGESPAHVLEAPFQHPGSVSVKQGMAIYHVMHNQADRSDWDVIDAWVHSKGLEQVLAEIGATLRMNSIPTSQLQRELSWWRGQITKPGEN